MITAEPALASDFSAIIRLVLQQEMRQHQRDPRLHTGREEQILRQLRGTDLSLVAHNEAGQVRGFVQPAVWTLPASSLLHAFLSADNGIARQLTLPPPTESDADEVAAALLSALSSGWKDLQTDGDLLRWPSCDTSWIEPALLAHRFQLDSVCASLKEPQPLSWDQLPSSMRIRGAGPEDEEALMALFREELRFHTTCVPFARMSQHAIVAFGEKLARLWDEGNLESGAPLVLVVEQHGEVIALAEATLLSITPDMEPGFTPPGSYGVIENLCVREEVRGKGIGTALVGAVFAALAYFDLSGYLLWYNPGNALAAHFWPKMGFEPLWTTYQRRNTPAQE